MTSFKTSDFVVGEGIIEVLDINVNFDKDGIPEELKRHAQWVTWTYMLHDNHGKPTKGKLPVYVAGNQIRKAKWNSPVGQCSFDEAYKRYQSCDLIHGVGFVFTKDDPFVFIDLDKFIENDERIQYWKGNSFTETSQSGNGLHIFVKGKIDKAHKPTTGEVEIYSDNRFCAMTGCLYKDSPLTIVKDQGLIDSLITAYPHVDRAGSAPTGRTGGTRRSGGGAGSRSGFTLPDEVGEGARDNTMHAYCWSLAARGYSYDEAFEAACLANEEKFNPPLDEGVIIEKLTRAMESIAEEVDSHRQWTERYIFVSSANKFYDIKTGTMLSAQSLNIVHKREFPGGRGQRPVMATMLSEHPDFQSVDNLTWMPAPFGKEDEMRFIDYEGARLVNTWRGFAAVPIPGDVETWLELGLHLCGDQKTLDVVLQRLAYDVQRPHEKCNWGLVFHGIQGAGKDLFLTPISRIFGSAYSIVGDGDIKSDYDDGFIRSKVVVVNEVKNLRGAALERLKQKTASESGAMSLLNPKKENKLLHPNLWSIIMNTNHPDALKFDKAERRFYVVECLKSMEATMDVERREHIINKVIRDEMHVNSVMHYLCQIDLSNFDPGVIPERTAAFYNMFDLTRDDMESTLDDLEDLSLESFNYDFVTPDLLLKDLMDHDVRYTKKSIKVWLKKNGWVQHGEKIVAKVNNKVLSKSRLYHMRHDSKWRSATPSDLWHAIEAQEVLIEAASKQRFSGKAS